MSNNLTVINTDGDENLQLAENENVEKEEATNSEYTAKRELLKKTKIVKQTWSILEIYQKINDGRLILDPNYQRREIWKSDKKTAFIESLYMGIMIPPIYVVEIPGKDLLSENRYEVVDGKQRLTTIINFIKGTLVLDEKSLEYYTDLFGGKTFTEINETYSEKTTEMLSSVLDIYVITANSPDFTKYDIFARLNKGAEKLKVNEIRRAIYHSFVTNTINTFIENRISDSADEIIKTEYKNLFSQNDIKRFEDYGRFYKSIAFYMKSNIESGIVEDYNSRPRDMINTVLQSFQKDKISLSQEKVNVLLSKTIELLKLLIDNQYKEYLIDACIPFVINRWEQLVEKLNDIQQDAEIINTFDKSPATTRNVNRRLERVASIMRG